MAVKGSKLPKEAKRVGISVPLTPAQKAAITIAARRVGLDPAAFVRSAALARTEYDPDKDEPRKA